MSLTGKTAVVTGGTKGIGRAIAESLMHAGVNVSISARNEVEVERAVTELNAIVTARAAGFKCDVRDEAQVKSYFAQTVETFGGVDILVNNAGIGLFEPVELTSGEEFRAVIETNLCGVFYCCHEAIPLMK